MDIDIKIQWHTSDTAWVAVFMRDGEPWYLDGALVGMGFTIDEAVAELIGIAHGLVVTGENFLTESVITLEDRTWLFKLLDRGNEVDKIQARYEAIRQAEEPISE